MLKRLLAVLFLAGSLPAIANTDVTVVYWSARDCTWCTHWEGGGKAQLEQSPEFPRIRFRMVKSERLEDKYSRDMFAPDIAWLWDRYTLNGHRNPGRPSWDVYVGQERVATFYGTKSWDGQTLPFIRSVANQSSAERQALVSRQTELPVASRFAPIDKADAVPYLGWGGRRAYERFLDGASPRAFAIAANGAYGFAYGSGAAQEALANCQPHAGGGSCRLYVLNNDVVW